MCCASAQNLVRLDAVATNSKGEPVTDLQAADVNVREDGKLRNVLFLRRSGVGAPAEVLAAGQYGNRAQPGPTLILLDRWNERILTAATAWIDLTTALQHMESVSRIYIYILTARGDLYPVRPLPDPDADLRQPPDPSPTQLAAALDTAIKKLQGFRDIDAQDPVLRANVTFQALNALGQRLANMSGRKNLIWVTHGVPLTIELPGSDWLDMTPQIRDLSTRAAQSQIAIYSVDQSAQAAGADPSSLSRATLEKFSGYTGGRWYPSGNTDRAVADALADARGVYSIVYEGTERKRDKKDHKIRLESTRKDVRLLTRDSDRGQAPDTDPDAAEQVALRAACHSPF
ncbi:MAG: VWA domain-containing protein, partial [Acidobacteriia bacterium]|nr:VWA domain-containing protein [Terriglobia bacterium]